MLSLSKLLMTVAITAGALSTYPSDCQAKDTVRFEQQLDTLEKRVNLLEMDRVVYGPISIHHVHFNNAKHFITLQPGQSIDCSFCYKLDSSQQDFLDRHHLIVGLDNTAQVCATHLYGVWNSSGTAKFNLIAPLQEGDYDVRVAYRPGDRCEDALNSWNVLKNQPSSFATIGIIRVRHQHQMNP